jgi:TatD DNase family protein
MLIDSHVNLHAEAFAEDLEAVLARARAAGVGCMVSICDRFENAKAVAAIAHAHDDIWMSVGAHPHYAKDHLDLTAETLIAFAQANPKVAAIGETGIDLHYGYSPLSDQKTVLWEHIKAARALDLPLIIHTREADEETAGVLRQGMEEGAFRLLLHCYTSGLSLMQEALTWGAYVSLSGIATFKSAHDVRAVGEHIPLDRLILETDCPYLAPIPHRGRRNEPAFVADVYAYVSAWRGLDPAAGQAMIAENFFRLFHTIRPPA